MTRINENTTTRQQFSQSLPKDLSADAVKGTIIETLAKDPAMLNDPKIQDQLRAFCKEVGLNDLAQKNPLTAQDLQTIVPKLLDQNGKVDTTKLFAFLDAFDKDGYKNSIAKDGFASRLHKTLLGTPQKELERYTTQEILNPGYRASIYRQNKPTKQTAQNKPATTAQTTATTEAKSTTTQNKAETQASIAARILAGKKQGPNDHPTLDLSTKTGYAYKKDNVSVGDFSLRLPVQERIAAKKAHHITGPQKGSEIILNEVTSRIHKEIREGKHAQGVVLHKDRIEVTDPVLKNRIEILARSYAQSVKNEGQAYTLHGTTAKFLVDHHMQRAYTTLTLLALRYGTEHPLLKEVFEGATQLEGKADTLQLHRNIELRYAQLLNDVVQQSKKDWTTGGLDISVLGIKK